MKRKSILSEQKPLRVSFTLSQKEYMLFKLACEVWCLEDAGVFFRHFLIESCPGYEDLRRATDVKLPLKVVREKRA